MDGDGEDDFLHDDADTTSQAPRLDHRWVTYPEMQELLDKNTFKAVDQMLLPED